MPIYDITPPIHESLAVFPGDQPFKRHINLSFQQGDSLLLSSLTSTLHLGAHTDAPNHYSPQGECISQRSLHYYMGRVQVISVASNEEKRIYSQHLKGQKIVAPRVLLRTLSFPDPDRWEESFTALSPELVNYLHSAGVILVGIDTPSVDPASSKLLESHQQIYQLNMAILEGIVLKHVPDGIYNLVALPLPIVGGDASPVRAILFSGKFEDLDQNEINIKSM